MTYCISDMHGDLERWNNMLELIRFSGEDTLYVLGTPSTGGPGALRSCRTSWPGPMFT